MKLMFAFLVAFFVFSIANAFDESINYQPGLNLYNEAAQLTDLISPHGSQLCAPIAMTHGMHYLKYNVGYSSLATVQDLDRDGKADTFQDRIRYFFKTCGTDINLGTHYHEAQACLKNYLEQSGYKSFAYIIGPHAINAPPGVALGDYQHVVTVADVRAAVDSRAAIIMAVGWYNYVPATKSYTRIGGHFFNLYGYDYMNIWGETRLSLKAVNSLVNYTGRRPEQMFDALEMNAVPKDGTSYPVDARFVITGPGFNFVQKTLVEDIFVALPLARDTIVHK